MKSATKWTVALVMAFQIIAMNKTAEAVERDVRDFAGAEFTGGDNPRVVRWSSGGGGIFIDLTDPTASPQPSTTPSDAAKIMLLALDAPPITEPNYAIVGEVSYKDVEPAGNFEMWSYFPDGGAYFTRTLAEGGPLQKIQGTSLKRSVRLPFISKPGMIPSRITLSVVMPGKGSFELQSVRLVQDDGKPEVAESSVTPLAGSSSQSSFLTATLLAAAVLGLGLLIPFFVIRGKGRVIAITLAGFVAAVGVTLLAVAGYAAFGNPVSGWVPAFGVGATATLLAAFTISHISRQFDRLEIQKMHAMDVD